MRIGVGPTMASLSLDATADRAARLASRQRCRRRKETPASANARPRRSPGSSEPLATCAVVDQCLPADCSSARRIAGRESAVGEPTGPAVLHDPGAGPQADLHERPRSARRRGIVHAGRYSLAAWTARSSNTTCTSSAAAITRWNDTSARKYAARSRRPANAAARAPSTSCK